MSTSTSRLAYTSHFELMDRALAGNGIRVKCEDYGKACRLRLELYTARKIDRRENARIEEPDSPMHGRSPYDPIRCTVEQIKDTWWLYIQVVNVNDLEIEELDARSRSADSESHSEPLPKGRRVVQDEPSELHGSDQEGFEATREAKVGGIRR